ncbi:MAG: outer membrane protein assembly factor BamC [Acidithiobacillus sp.]
MGRKLGRSIAVATLATVALSGCSYLPFFKSNTGPNYQDAKLMKPLEVPPDLLAQAPAPGVTVPGGPVTAGEVASEVSGARSSGGYGLFVPRVAPGEKPIEEKTLPGVSAQVAGQGADLYLATSASDDQIWKAVRAVLAKDKIPVEKFSAEAGTLDTGWQYTRSGISRIFGTALAPSHKMRYRFRLVAAADGQKELHLEQERYLNNPEGSTINWRKQTPEASRNRDLLEAVRQQLERSVILAEMPVIKVTRYRDDLGPYLVLDQVPEKAEPAVAMALRGLDHPVTQEGVGVWSVQVRAGSGESQHSGGMVGNMFSQAWYKITHIFGGSKKTKPLDVTVKLLRMKDNEGSVLETEAPSDEGKDGQKAAIDILDRLQSALSPKDQGKA